MRFRNEIKYIDLSYAKCVLLSNNSPWYKPVVIAYSTKEEELDFTKSIYSLFQKCWTLNCSTKLNVHYFLLKSLLMERLGLSNTYFINRFRYSFICQGTSTRRQRSDLFGLRVNLPPVTTSLTTQR